MILDDFRLQALDYQNKIFIYICASILPMVFSQKMLKFNIIVVFLLYTKCYFSQEKVPYQGYALNALSAPNERLQELTPALKESFTKWVEYLNANQLFDIRKDDICKEYQNGNLEYDFSNTLLPLKITFVKYVKFYLKETEYFYIKYDLDNCVGGNAYFRDFVFFKRNANLLEFDLDLTNKIKKEFLLTVQNKLNVESDGFCHAREGSNFIYTDGLIISDVKGDYIIGKYVLQGDGANCCPQYSGDFEYSISNNKLVFINEVFASQNNDANSEDVEEESLFSFIENEPEYIGGESAMNKFIQKNLILPKSDSASTEEVRLKIIVRFIIEKDGTMSNIKIEKRGFETEKYDKCIIQCFQKMPKWKPAELKGVPVRSLFSVPLTIYN